MARDAPFTVERNDFVSDQKTFYSTPIEIAHWQLRHYVANPEPNILYYASKNIVYSINTVTHKFTHIATLPFAVRCFAAGYGYVCAGGGIDSEFAIVKLNPSWAAEVDALLPVNLGPNSQRQKDVTVDVKRFGSDIVNSVTIHKLKDPDSLFGDDVVAVITSNDKTTRILSLTQGNIQTAMLEVDFAVNHATISPDGELLVVVGDYHHSAYFFERTYSRAERPGSLGGHASSLCSWELLRNPPLHVPKSVATTGYFTTAWSPSGHLCAVASECGYITIFDTEKLKNSEDSEGAEVAVFPGTRPESQPGPGAVRALMFSPAPFDLLAWAEDQGRVVVADLRDSCRSQQILKLERGDGNVTPIPFERPSPRPEEPNDDATRISSEYESMQRYLDQYEQSPTERRRIEEILADIRRESEDTDGDRYPSLLTARELEVLDSLRTTDDPSSLLRRGLGEGREPGSSSPRPRSIHYRPSELGGRRTVPLSRDDDFPTLTRSRANTEWNHEAMERMRAIREYIRRGSGTYPIPDDREDATLQSMRRLLHSTRRDPSSTLSNDEIEAMLDRASSLDAVRRTSNDSPLSGPRIAASSSSAETSTMARAAANREAAQAARRRGQVELVIANSRAALRGGAAATASGSGSNTTYSPRDAWTPHRHLPRYLEHYANIDTYIPSGLSGTSNSTSTANTASEPPPTVEAARALADRERQRERERDRDRAERTERSLREVMARPSRLEIAGRVAGMYLHRRDLPDPAYGVQTAGLAWSEDGRRLWAACAEGIWEFEVDVKGRMGMSAVEFH